MADPTPTPREFVQAVLPGLLSPKVATLVVGAALVGLLVGLLAALLNLGPKERALLGAGAVLAWGHGAAWLVTGELESLPSAFTNLSGVQWVIFVALWWTPATAAYIIYGVSTS